MAMRKPLKRKGTPSTRTAAPTSIAAPTGGWNAKDPLANMRPDQAILLNNIFPRTTDVILRNGAENHVTGFVNTVRSLMAFNGVTTKQLFAATDVGIYNATAAGVVGAAVTASSLGVYSHANFNTLGGNYLVAVNGANALKLYNGTTWTDITGASVPAITGVTTSELIAVTVFKRRLWFIRKDTMSAYYLGTDQIAGAAVEFPVGQLCKFGGTLVAIGSWTIDGGDGADDHLVLVTSSGEVLVYRGTDPSSAATFALVGVYFIAPPVGGARSLVKYGGDLLLMTQSGLYPLSKALQSTTVTRQTALSSNIQQPISDAARANSSFSGWQVCVYAQENALLVNIPTVEQNTAVQYVMNSITGAWCQFIGWNALCFEVFENELYFGGTDYVAKAWTGAADFGADIVGDCRQAFNYFGLRGMLKHVKLVRPILLASGSYSFATAIDVDFDDLNTYALLPSSSSSFGVFDVSNWDEVPWAPDLEVRKDWLTVFSKPGFAISLRLRIASKTATVTWVSTDYVVERGGIL